MKLYELRNSERVLFVSKPSNRDMHLVIAKIGSKLHICAIVPDYKDLVQKRTKLNCELQVHR